MDYGAKVSQKTYDVKTVADRLSVFSSSFQTLKVHSAQQVTGTIPSSGTNTITLTHNLGYYAPYIVIYNGDSTAGQGTSSFFAVPIDESAPPGISVLTTRQYQNYLEIDVPSSYGSSGDTIYFTVYLFVDDFRTVEESTIKSSTTSTDSTDDYGFKVSKEGYSVWDADDSELVISSSFFNNIVHKKGISDGADVSHDLGYIPNYLAYGKRDAESFIQYIAQVYSQDYFDNIDTTTLYFPPFPYDWDDMYYIIFKNVIE